MKVLEQSQVKDFYSYIKESLGDCSMSVVSSLIMCNRETLGKNMDVKINEWKYKSFGERLKRLFFSVYILKTQYPEITPKEISNALRIPVLLTEVNSKPMSPVVLINSSLEESHESYMKLKNLCIPIAEKLQTKNSKRVKVLSLIREVVSEEILEMPQGKINYIS